MTTTRPVWQDKPGVQGTIRSSPIPELQPHQVLVKVYAWALNPCDAFLQDNSLPFVSYPVILGQDIAGTVIAVGSTASTKFTAGDRIFGFTCNNGFSENAVLDSGFSALIPETLSYAQAAVFPLTVTTASLGLFAKKYLALPFPSLNPTALGKSLLIWGGSSSVGSNAIQLAKAAGLQVLTTCSPRNFDTARRLGAEKVFDYNAPNVVEDIITELDNISTLPCAGIIVAAGDVSMACQVSLRSKQTIRVASASGVNPGDAPEGVDAKMIYPEGEDVMLGFKETVAATFGGYLPEALKVGVYQVAPEVEVVSRDGLEGIQGALELMKKGVSGKKLVVERVV
ncbi:chaperonin 10-like protein [Aspergillus carlsbadensis]|nr:chaperonin 10-like protein [Aspergillus carlsbadensis]